MDELFEFLESSNSRNKMRNYDFDDEVNSANTSDEEEGEIKESYEIKDFDLADLDNSFGSNEHDLQNAFIDEFLKTHADIKPDFNNFDNSIFDNIDCGESSETNIDLNDINETFLVKSEAVVAPENRNAITNNYAMRPVRKEIESDADTDGDSDSIEEIDLPTTGSILDSMLASRRNKTKSQVETTKKGRIVDKEAELEYLLPADLEEKLSRIVISPNAALVEVGTVIQRVEGTQTITVKAARSDPILDLNTIVLGRDKRMIGMIDNIFGVKKEPMYLVVCKNQTIASSFRGGEQLFCAPFVENAYFTAADTPDMHCDLDSDLAFSDDEQEERHKRAMLGQEPPRANKKKKVNRKRKCGPNQFQPRQNYQQQNHQNQQQHQRYAGQKNPFRTVSTQPFTNQSALPYWQAPRAPNPMMMMMNPPAMSAGPPPYLANQYNPAQSFMNFPPPMMNLNQCTSYQQFQQFYPQQRQ